MEEDELDEEELDEEDELYEEKELDKEEILKKLYEISYNVNDGMEEMLAENYEGLIPKELANDSEFMLEAISITPYAMYHLSSRLKNNEEFMTQAFSRNAGVLRFAEKMNKKKSFQKSINEINESNNEKINEEIGEEKYNRIKEIRNKYLPTNIFIPAPIKDGKIEYSYYDEEYDEDSSQKREYYDKSDRQEHVIIEYYKDGEIERIQLFDGSSNYSNENLWFNKEGNLEEKNICYDEGSDVPNIRTYCLYRNDGSVKGISRYLYDKVEKESKVSQGFSKDDGSAISYEIDRHINLMCDKDDNCIYLSSRKDKGGKDIIKRTFFDLKNGNKISREEFMKQLDEINVTENEIISRFGISKEELIDNIKKDGLFYDDLIRPGICTYDDIDSNDSVEFSRSIQEDEKICSIRGIKDGKESFYRKYKEPNKFISQTEIDLDAKATLIYDSLAENNKEKEWIHDIEEVEIAVNDRSSEDIRETLDQISKVKSIEEKENDTRE